MRITFYSNYLTHHQIPFCDAMIKHENVKFTFVSTMPMEDERISGGWDLGESYSYEVKAYASPENEAKALRLAQDSDVIIIGSAPERYVDERMKHGKSKLTFRYSERIYKGGYWRAISPRGMFIRWKTYFRYIRKPLYMLCASAYTAGDLAILGSYIGRCFKWGYFPAVKKYEDIDHLIAKKKPGAILWVARLIDWKHPEIPVRIAKRLKDAGYSFELNMIGNGAMESEIKELLLENDVEDCVHLLGSMKPEQVREHMESAQILLFTSDRNEGWGAVLNEAMNSACAVVASNAIGSVPFLINNVENGYMYKDGDENDLFARVKILLDNPDECRRMGKAAYESITGVWNAEEASERLLTVCKNLLHGKKEFYTNGVCSKAHIIIGKARTNAHLDHI